MKSLRFESCTYFFLFLLFLLKILLFLFGSTCRAYIHDGLMGEIPLSNFVVSGEEEGIQRIQLLGCSLYEFREL